jgi:hypothetical protein
MGVLMTGSAPEKMSDDEWQERATASAVAACRDVLNGSINPRTPLSMLGEIEWGWIACAAIFAWISTRAEQAVAEGMSPETTTTRMTQYELQPWEAGVVASVLPQLGNISGLDWSKAIGAWSKDQITAFAWEAYQLIGTALQARDASGVGIVTSTQDRVEREHSAKHGGPLMSRKEQTEECPF